MRRPRKRKKPEDVAPQDCPGHELVPDTDWETPTDSTGIPRPDAKAREVHCEHCSLKTIEIHPTEPQED